MKRIWLLSFALLAVAAVEFGLLGAASAGASFVPGWLATSKDAQSAKREKPPATPVSPPACQPDRRHGGTPACDQQPASIQLTPDPLVIRCDGTEVSTITVRITDSKSRPVPDGTLVAFGVINGDFLPHDDFDQATRGGVVTARVVLFGDSHEFDGNVSFSVGGLYASVRVNCLPPSPPPCAETSPPSSPPCPTPTQPPCPPSPPETSPPCATPTPPPTNTPSPPCSVSPPSLSPPCATPTPLSPPCSISPPSLSPPCATPTPNGGIRTGNTFVVDADGTTPGIQSSRFMAVGGGFTISSVLTAAPDPYQAFQSNIAYDRSILWWTSSTQHVLGSATICSGPGASDPTLYDGCARSTGTQFDTGDTVDYVVTCIAPGTSVLHLLTDADIGPALATNFALAAGVAAATTVDASVTCVGAGTPTPAPTPTASAIPVG